MSGGEGDEAGAHREGRGKRKREEAAEGGGEGEGEGQKKKKKKKKKKKNKKRQGGKHAGGREDEDFEVKRSGRWGGGSEEGAAGTARAAAAFLFG